MDYSYSRPTEVHCPHCNQMVTVDVWLILDQGSQPDSIQSIIEGSFQTHPCPNCSKSIQKVDQPILIYQSKLHPSLLFAPALKTTLKEDQTHTLQQLVQHLMDTLDTSDDDWIMEGLKRVRWKQLPIILSKAT
ncbi:CpXC domain-containing protein [Acaryochloris sp. 'Moss Beach']|uniref:CpXC domain-containing protein n=1 Tax=Acaryochloris sp. 'Moss Beach' TaxID=2740837 RepID=UPI00210610E9|nr:CpXC domain-containing protein [Acaryochloris sp. 'Moss Beach']